jgi:putative ABC transport system ATP-binding protein
MTTPIISLRGIGRTYDMGAVAVEALRSVDLDVDPGEFLAIIGPSGSGKSTLMHILGCLDRPTTGTYTLAGDPVEDLDDDGLARVRSRTIGFVFQSYNLLPRTSALDNVVAPLLYQGVRRRERVERARTALERLGLGDRVHHEPSELSGGQQQRVAVARALVTDPSLILADEPTANLDTANGEQAMTIMQKLNEQTGTAFIFATHDQRVISFARRIVEMQDGKIVGDKSVGQ